MTDSQWRGVSGVLPRQMLRDLIEDGAISSATGTVPQENLQPASLDLTLGPVAHRLRCSFLPGNHQVRHRLRDYHMGDVDLNGGAVLERGRAYLIPLNERLKLPPGIRGRTNPRSSTGRVDVFTRVVTDRGQHFDEIRKGYEGELFLEVVPISFTVKVRAGLTLNQLRLISGSARVDDRDLLKLWQTDPIVYPGLSAKPGDQVRVTDGLFLSVDLSGEGRRFVGYKAKKTSALFDFASANEYQIGDFWEQVRPRRGRMILEPEEFYLLVSRERVRIPPDFAAEMAAYDPTSGELRTHYAGFFDPGFGDVPAGETPGTPAVLEVRARDVLFALEHGQRLCKLTFEHMAARPEEVYGAKIGSQYQRQYLTLGRQFKPERRQGQSDAGQMRLRAQEPLPLEWVPEDREEPLVPPAATNE